MIKVITHVAKAVVAIVTALLFFSCGFEANLKKVDGSGNVVTKERKLTGDYKAISADRDIEVLIEQGTTYAVTVEADDNLHQHIITKVKNGELKISSDANIRNASSTKVIVRLPAIERIEASSEAEITSRNTLKSESITLNTDSGGYIEVTIEANKANCDSNSGSRIKVSGKVDHLEASASSGGMLNAKGLAAKKVKAEASSGGNTHVNPEEDLSADASSGGKIFFVKTPESLDKETSSGGEVLQE